MSEEEVKTTVDTTVAAAPAGPSEIDLLRKQLNDQKAANLKLEIQAEKDKSAILSVKPDEDKKVADAPAFTTPSSTFDKTLDPSLRGMERTNAGVRNLASYIERTGKFPTF